jgi:hypothetical protein
MTFFEALRKKLMLKPDRHFDQRFWARFEAEAGLEKRTSSFAFFSRPVILRFSTALVLAVAIYVGQHLYFKPSPQDITMGADLISQKEMIEDLEFFLAIEDVDMSDEDWKLLIADSGEYEK